MLGHINQRADRWKHPKTPGVHDLEPRTISFGLFRNSGRGEQPNENNHFWSSEADLDPKIPPGRKRARGFGRTAEQPAVQESDAADSADVQVIPVPNEPQPGDVETY